MTTSRPKRSPFSWLRSIQIHIQKNDNDVGSDLAVQAYHLMEAVEVERAAEHNRKTIASLPYRHRLRF